ncbi:MAG TPA: hypothetical protein VGW78_00970 [Candidatus Babeliales bacterium]|jgi:hypothetical protein|nr:hypothetical protein [Candidatus Babeliales bacterium]
MNTNKFFCYPFTVSFLLFSIIIQVQCNDLLRYVPKEIIMLIYECCGVTECGRLAATSKTLNVHWKTVLDKNPFYYIPFRTDSFNDQAYAETIAKDRYDKAAILGIKLNKNSWIFDKDTGYFFVFASVMHNPKDKYSSKALETITRDTKVHRNFGMLLHGQYNSSLPSKIKFLSKHDFYNLTHDKRDRMCYAVNKDRTQMVLAGWFPCPHFCNDGMDEWKALYYIDAKKSKCFGYILRESLNLINYKNIAFLEDRVALQAEVRTNQESAIIQYARMGEDESSILISTETPCMNIQYYAAQKCIADFILGENTGNQAVDVEIDNSNYIPINPLSFGNPLPKVETKVISVAKIINDHKQGKINTEGMDIFLKSINNQPVSLWQKIQNIANHMHDLY